MKRAGWPASLLLFGVPAAAFALLFHLGGPALRRAGVSWFVAFHLLLTLPLAILLVASIVGARREAGGHSWSSLRHRLRLNRLDAAGWAWTVALSGFMYGGNIADLVAIAASYVALWREKRKAAWMYAAVIGAILLKRNAALLAGTLQRVQIFDPSAYYNEFFSHFGPGDFMGVPLQGAWWIPLFYVLWLLAFNIAGEELWWRGYVLPRQVPAFGGAAFLIHGILWSAFHLFMQPTLWDTFRMSITGVALSFVVQRTRSTWSGIIGHTFANLPFLMGLIRGTLDQ